MKKIKIIKNMSELGAGSRGSSLAAKALEISAINKGSNLFSQLQFVDIQDENKKLYEESKTPFAKHITSIYKIYERISETIVDTISKNEFPLVISADHSSAGGTIAGLRKIYPKLGVIWIDAHGDLHSPYTTPTGNMHGMPLASALAKNNEKYQINDVFGKSKEYWEKLKNIHNIIPKINPQDLIMFGVRDIENSERKLMEELNIKNYKVDEVKERGIENCLNEATKKISHCNAIYISFDVDSMDCNIVSKGTGTPVSNGFNPQEIKQIITHFVNQKNVKCIEITEINPLLDNKCNKMADTTFSILKNIVESL